jgi:membrane protease YdiL (CAAX protease family)
MIFLFVSAYLKNFHTEKPVNIPGPVFGLFASISAGISEETTFRFCLIPVFIWLGSFFNKGTDIKPSGSLLWTANIISAILFGVVHISNLSAMNVHIDASNVGVVVFLNTIAGLSFGYMFLKYGLFSAMIMHFSTDIVLHVIGPILR